MIRMMYVYRELEPGLFTVGFYDPTNKWYPESDWPNAESAAERVNFLNGGEDLQGITSTLEKMAEKLEDIYYNTRFIASALKDIADAQTVRSGLLKDLDKARKAHK